jgi:RNA polymerase sigma-70 factor (ECF subfamily)
MVKALQQGDETAFRSFVEAWQDMVFNTILGIVQNEEDAEDVAQDSFIQAYESIGHFKGESKLSTWLYRIAVSKALDHLRRKKRKKRFAFVQSLFGLNEDWPLKIRKREPSFLQPSINFLKIKKLHSFCTSWRDCPIRRLQP